MGSLVRRNNSRILIAVAVFVLFGLLSPPAWAGSNIEGRKIQLLELLGLDGADPAVVKAAQEAHTLYGVDVVPGQDAMSVILKLSEAPDYKMRFDENKKRLVVDLSNTINLSPSPLQSLSVDDPIMRVRNSQYQVNPMLVSRVVLDLKDAEQPGVAVDGSNIVITTSRGQSETEVAAPKTQNMPSGEVIAVPAVAVDTASPKMDSTFSHAEVSSVPAAEMKHAQPAAAKPVAVQEPPAEEIVLISQAVSTAEPKAEQQMEEPAASEAPGETAPEEAVASETPENTAPEEPAAKDAIAELIQETAPAESVQEETQPAKEAAASEVTIEPQVQMIEVPVKIEPKPKAPAPEAKPASESQLGAAGSPRASDEVSTRDDLVTLSFRDADLSAVLDILARKGDLNILAGKDVRGTVTVRLVDVPFDVALNAVLNVNGYGYIKTDNIVRVLPLKELGSPVETKTETFMLSYAEAKKAKTTLKSLLSANGTIETDDRTNMLIVTDVPAKVEEVRNLIPQIDRRVQQVLIEVLILDSALRDSTDLGITWNLTDANDSVPGPEGNDSFGVILPKPIGGLDVNVGTLLDGTQLNVLVQALSENTDSRILANPKILTVDNESASIEIVEEFPYNDVTQTSSGGQLSNITFKEIGTKLEVKPQVTHDEHVILWISPEQNSLAGETITGVPIVDTRRAETTLVVRNHQTVVLGGLRENRRMKNLNKVPFLGDLPGVKYAFRNVSSSDQDTELLVFLTVHIVESPPLLASDEIKFDELANMPRKTSVEMDLVR